MKQTIFITLFSSFFVLQVCGQPGKSKEPGNIKTKEYKNGPYRFSADIPGNWKLYGQIINDTVNHKAIADWGLPPVYSDLEKTEIENSISITAYKRSNITTVDALILAEYLRIDPTKHAMEVDSATKNARLIYSTINGKNYKGKSYFVFKNGIGYVVNFMATPGTFGQNIKVFEMFYKSIRFL